MLQFCCAGVEYFLVAKRSKDQATSELEIALDHAIVKNGT
jgi:phage gp36-like protein